MKIYAIIGLCVLVLSSPSLAQFTPECNQLRGLYRQHIEYFEANPFNSEESGILDGCKALAVIASLNGGQTFEQNLSGCFFAGCIIGKTTSKCTGKATIIKDSLILSDRMKAMYCPESGTR